MGDHPAVFWLGRLRETHCRSTSLQVDALLLRHCASRGISFRVGPPFEALLGTAALPTALKAHRGGMTTKYGVFSEPGDTTIWSRVRVYALSAASDLNASVCRRVAGRTERLDEGEPREEAEGL